VNFTLHVPLSFQISEEICCALTFEVLTINSHHRYAISRRIWHAQVKRDVRNKGLAEKLEIAENTWA
jgi:hypothetical protein